MKIEDVSGFRNPRTGGALEISVHAQDGGEVSAGNLRGDGDEYEIYQGIPRFCSRENYAGSFGFQWNKYDRLQLDSKEGWGDVSRNRLFEQTEWARNLTGQRILEAGSGMGRFTEHLLRTGADVWSFDYSSAVDANKRNNGAAPNLHLAQGDIFSPPYSHESFDKVLCIGVIQHTPDPAAAFASLVRFLKPGGQIAIDSYRLDWKSLLLGKYWLRPLTKRLPTKVLHPLVRAQVRAIYPLTGVAQKLIGRRGRSLSWMLGIADYRGVFDADPAMLRDLAELDTFDMLAPAHDHPKTLAQVRKWFDDAGLIDIRVRPGWNGIEAIGRKPT